MARPKKKQPARKPATTRLKRPTSKPAKTRKAKAARGSLTQAALKTTKQTPARTERPTSGPITVRARFTDPLRRFNEHDSVRALIEAQASALGDRTFLIYEDDGREYSFATLNEKTSQAASLLRSLGAGDGARVALLMPNSPEFIFMWLGAMKAGLIAVPVHSDLDGEQIRSVLEDCGAAVLVIDESLWNKVGGYYSELPGLHAVLVANESESLSGVPVHADRAAAGDDALPLIALESALERASTEPSAVPQARWWDEAEILYTGHDEPHPRGAILQHRQFLTAARWLTVWLKLSRRDRIYNALPLFNSNAQVLGVIAPLALGATVVLSRDFNVARVWRAVERYRATVMVAVPTMLGIMSSREVQEARGVRGEAPWPAAHESPGALGQRDDSGARERGLARAHDISSLRMVVCGSAPLPRATLKSFEQCFLVPVIEGFSMSETTCFATLNPSDGSRKLGSVGSGVGDKVAIQDDRRAPKPLDDNWQPTSLARMSPAIFPTANVGEPGEICVWGENVLKEYYNRPGENPKAFAGGWFHTGDIGRSDADGFIYVLGQRGQQVSLGGEAFMPREIDEALFSHRDVEQAASVTVADARRGSMVTTWVVMRRGTFDGGPDDGRRPANEEQQRAMQAQLKGWMATQLGDRKQPGTIVFAGRIPQDASGKTRVIELQRLARRNDTGHYRGRPADSEE